MKFYKVKYNRSEGLFCYHWSEFILTTSNQIPWARMIDIISEIRDVEKIKYFVNGRNEVTDNIITNIIYDEITPEIAYEDVKDNSSIKDRDYLELSWDSKTNEYTTVVGEPVAEKILEYYENILKKEAEEERAEIVQILRNATKEQAVEIIARKMGE